VSPSTREYDSYDFEPEIRPSRMYDNEIEVHFRRVYDTHYSSSSVERLSEAQLWELYSKIGEYLGIYGAGFNAPLG
jgi:hypothetical protein